MPFFSHACSILLTKIPSKHNWGRRHDRLRNQKILLSQFQGVAFDFLSHSLRTERSQRHRWHTASLWGLQGTEAISRSLSVSETQPLLSKYTQKGNEMVPSCLKASRHERLLSQEDRVRREYIIASEKTRNRHHRGCGTHLRPHNQ